MNFFNVIPIEDLVKDKPIIEKNPVCGNYCIEGIPEDGCPIHDKTLDNYPEHNTESERCWCSPSVVTLENGNKVIVHNDLKS